MKLHPEDPRITAYVLGELKPEDAALVEQAASEDPAVQAAIDEVATTADFLGSTLFATQPKLRPAQRHQVRQATKTPEKSNVVPIESGSRSWKPAAASLAAAALVIFAVVVVIQLPVFEPKLADTPPPSPKPSGSSTAANDEKEEWRVIPIQIALLPAPGPTDASKLASNDGANGSNAPNPALSASGNDLSGNSAPKAIAEPSNLATARDAAIARAGSSYFTEVAERLKTEPVPAPDQLPPLVRRGSVVAATSPRLSLPIQSGSASLDWVSHSIRQDHKMPPANAVRVEEILNHFALRPAGPAAVAQGVTVSTETLPCPWKPSASLLIVSFRGAAEKDSQIQAMFDANSSNVSRYRLLGFAPVSGIPDSSMPTHLPAKALTLIAIEIEPNNAATEFGTIQWTVNGQDAPAVQLSRRNDTEPSDDARFASLLCTYAQWLAGDQATLIDDVIVAALAREVAADNLPPDRFDLLNLIDQSLNL